MLLALSPASHGLSLGEISVRSALGQRLDATVPVRLGAGEALAGGCITTGPQSSDLRRVPDAEITTPQAAREGVYDLQVGSAAPLYEPMYELELRVQCPGSPLLVRQYVLMLDLPGAVAAGTAGIPVPLSTAVPNGETMRAESVPATAESQPVAVRQVARAPTTPIATGSSYRVQAGDTLSAIAARVTGRNVSRQAMADAIQAANPAAFIRNDANLILLGSEIQIPANVETVAPAPAETAAEAPAPNAEAVDPIGSPETGTAPPVAAPAPAPALLEAPAPVSVPEPAATAATAAPAPARPVVRPATPTPAKPVVEAPDEPAAADEPSPVVAAGAGIVFGLLVSTLLWLRGRFQTRKRAAGAQRVPESSARGSAAAAALPVVIAPRESEPGISVAYTPAHEDSLAAEFADEPDSHYAPPASSEDITSELESLFESTDTTIQKRLNIEKTIAARSLGGSVPDDSRPAYEPGSPVDFLVGGEPSDDAMVSSQTVDQPRPNLEPTVDQPRPNLELTAQTPTVDLRTLAASATGNEQQAQTLLEALTLLERDYEDELTASQVLDMSAVREALGEETDEPTQAAVTQLREPPARKKSR